MRFMLFTVAALAAIASPAAAEFGAAKSPTTGFQTSKPASPAWPGASRYAPPARPAFGSTYGAQPSAPKPKTYGAPPEAQPFKPFVPYKSQPGTSLFGPDSRKTR